MKKIILIFTVILLVVLGVAVLLNYNNASSQSDVKLQRSEASIGPLPFENSMVFTGRKLSFLVDTQCGLSMITPQTIAYLKSIGYDVDSTFCPVLWRDNLDELHFTTKRYKVTIPLRRWTAREDSLGNVTYTHGDHIDNAFVNVDFVPSTHNIDVLGLDFLSKWAIEYLVKHSTLTFHYEAPEGYEKLTDISATRYPLYLLTSRKRYFMPVEVSGSMRDYMIDTSLDNHPLRCPASDSITARGEREMMPVVSPRGEIQQVVVSREERVRIGNRSGSSRVSYFDEGHADYSINPFRHADQDMLIDFPSSTISLRPHFDMDHSPESQSIE